MEFIKNTVMRSVIETKTEEDIVGFSKKRTDEIRKYIKNVERMRNRGKGSGFEEIQE